jgi:hypothetical protein
LFEGNSVEGVFTMNRGLVTNALDLVNHEIYLERILLEVGRPVLDRYGPDLDRLDAFDRPAVQPDRQTSEPTAGRELRVDNPTGTG